MKRLPAVKSTLLRHYAWLSCLLALAIIAVFVPEVTAVRQWEPQPVSITIPEKSCAVLPVTQRPADSLLRLRRADTETFRRTAPQPEAPTAFIAGAFSTGGRSLNRRYINLPVRTSVGGFQQICQLLDIPPPQVQF